MTESNFPGGSGFGTSDVTNLRYDPVTGRLTWEYTFDLDYNSDRGGYGLNLYASVRAIASAGGFASADFGSTFRLTGVTNADGSAVAGGVTFDSGFVIAAAPDPTSATPAPPGLLAVAVGGIGLGLLRRRRGFC